MTRLSAACGRPQDQTISHPAKLPLIASVRGLSISTRLGVLPFGMIVERSPTIGAIMKETDIAYLAGVIDGEGCIMINRFATHRSKIGFQYRIIVEITMCDYQTIKFLADTFIRPIEERILHSGKIAYKIIWRNTPAANLLSTVLPYLMGKREQAVTCLAFQKITPGRGRDYKPTDFNVLEDFRLKVKWLKTAKALRC